MENYAEESVDYAEKTPHYAAISKINKAVPLAFSNVILPIIFVLCDMFDV